MNKKKFILFPLLAFVLSSCLFDTDDEGLSSWLSDQGMPSSYKVQTVTVGDLNPLSADVYRDTLPENARVRGLFGAVSGMSYNAFFDFKLEKFLDTLNAADSAKSYLHLRLLDSYYTDASVPSKMFPIEEQLKVHVSWIVSEKMGDGEYKDLENVTDSAWFHELESWNPKYSADTTISVSIKRKTDKNGKMVLDSLSSYLTIDMPKDLVEDVRKSKGNRRLQLSLSAPEASHIYRFYGSAYQTYHPQLVMEAMGKKQYAKSYAPMRSARVYSNREKCSDCLVLHGGVYDSLLVEFPSKPILKALSDFYGDEFPYTVGDSNDVRQAVVMAEVTFDRDDSKGQSELGLPLMVVVGTYMDSVDVPVFRGEQYAKLNKPLINASGHPNMVFHEGDSLSLQVTYGMRDFINRASDGRTFKMVMRLGKSVVFDKDSTYRDRVLTKADTIEIANGNVIKGASGDTLQVFFSDVDFARYDFSTIKSKPATLKLWLASKRGEE